MSKFGKEDLQSRYKNHHLDDECQGVWVLRKIGSDVPYKIDDGINVILVNPSVIVCEKCGSQFFSDGFEKTVHMIVAKAMVFDARPLTASHIRFLRSFAGLTQTQAAEELGYRKEVMSRYESKKDPTPMQSGEQVRFKLLIISKLGFEIPKEAQLWKAEKASLVGNSESIRRIDANVYQAS